MRAKRQKASKKLMHQYQVHFNFREPYQVLLDSQILQDAARFKIDLVGRLKKMLQGEIKPMITQCDIRHLYNSKPKDDTLIEQAKTYERRRCNHHELEEPLSSLECLSEVVDPKGSLTNKHRYIVASQDPKVRAHMRKVPGVPLIYISKSVVILEPMNAVTEEHREREEKAKFKAGLKGKRGANAGVKRKHDEEEDESINRQGDNSIVEQSTGDTRPQKKRKVKGPKGPNPLSVKKPKKRNPATKSTSSSNLPIAESSNLPLRVPGAVESSIAEHDEPAKRKRKRKHKPKAGGAEEADLNGETAVS
ncbi:hypothetical protein CC78DRAFT_528379 [Lojkania enalia]|uniref:U three protein 23 n=1 Tax=Lojkania enalia TaxID=147567 RepID=A0A9P4TRN7_9PLEO|nr:hypothetical protein CC78DRAFT_528379 [Didymosphaeria enalia]